MEVRCHLVIFCFLVANTQDRHKHQMQEPAVHHQFPSEAFGTPSYHAQVLVDFETFYHNNFAKY